MKRPLPFRQSPPTERTPAQLVAEGIARALRHRPTGQNTRFWLARESGVPQSTITKIEKGRQVGVDLAIVLRLARALGMTVTEFLGE